MNTINTPTAIDLLEKEIKTEEFVLKAINERKPSENELIRETEEKAKGTLKERLSELNAELNYLKKLNGIS